MIIDQAQTARIELFWKQSGCCNAALSIAGKSESILVVDKGRDPETQLGQLRDYAHRRNFEVMGEFIDFASGTTQDRIQYKLMMTAAKNRKLDVVLVWRCDRFARSTKALVNASRSFRVWELISSPIRII